MLVATAAGAQVATDTTWDPVVRRQVQALLDSASAQGLPVAPLTNRVLEAKARHTLPERLLEVLRAHADSMRATRTLLPGATPTEIDAGATALRSGVSRASLRRVRDARTAGQGAVAMLVLADLVRRGVAAPEAERAVLTLARRQDDAVLMELQQTFAREPEAPTPAALDRIVRKLERRAPVRPPDAACCATLPGNRKDWLAVAVFPDSASSGQGTGLHAQAGTYIGSVASARLWALGEASAGASKTRWRLGVLARRPLAESPGMSLSFRASAAIAALGMYRSGSATDTALRAATSGVVPQMEGSAGLASIWALPKGFSVHAAADLRMWRATQAAFGQVGTRPVIMIDSTNGQSTPSGASVPVFGYSQVRATRTASIGHVGLGWRGTLLEMEGGRATQLAAQPSGSRLSPWVVGWRAAQTITPTAAIVVEYSPTPEPQLWNAGDLGASRLRVGARLLRGTERRVPTVASSHDGDIRFAYRISANTSADDERLVLEVTAPNARLVEVDGDLTQWRPVSMQREGPGRFHVSLPLPVGLSRVRIRIDGGPWIAPPGLTSVADDAGGLLGVIPGR
jgi:hypothetical protein